MKYCSKCGNELLDEAVICPKCGCAVENTSNRSDKSLAGEKRSKFATGTILNNIAGVLNIGFAVFFRSVLVDETPVSDANLTISSDGSVTLNPIGLPHESMFYFWLGAVIVLFIIGLFISKIPNVTVQKICGYVYTILSFISALLMLEAFPNILAAIMCIWGMAFFIPTILQVLAGIKFLQGAYKK